MRLGPIARDDAIGASAPPEAARRMVGQQRDDTRQHFEAAPSIRTGRAQAGQPAGLASGPVRPDRARGTSLSRPSSRNSAASPARPRELVDERCDIGRARPVIERRRDRFGRQRFDLRRRERHRLDPETRLDPVDTQPEEAHKMLRIARRPRRPTAISCSRASTRSQRDRGAHAQPALFEIGDEVADQIVNHLFDRLGGRDRLKQPAPGLRHLEGTTGTIGSGKKPRA